MFLIALTWATQDTQHHFVSYYTGVTLYVYGSLYEARLC